MPTPQAVDLLQSPAGYTLSGFSPRLNDGINPLRAVQGKSALVAWNALPGLYTLDGFAFIRDCGRATVRLGDSTVTLSAAQADAGGYQGFWLSGVVRTQPRITIETFCAAGAKTPVLLYRADLYRITPPPAPAWERPLGVGLVMLLLCGLVWLLGLRRLS